MPRVLRIVNRFNLGGPTFNAAYLTKYLTPDFETLLIGGLKDEEEDCSEFILESLGVNYQVVPEMRRAVNFRDDRKAFRIIKDIIRDFKPDIVHTHASKAGALGRIAAKQLKVPVTVHTFHGHVFHSYFGMMKTEMYKAVERYLAKGTSKIIAISNSQKRELVQRYSICIEDKIEVIRLGFELIKFKEDQSQKRELFRNYYGVEEDEIAIGIIGRVAPIKNHHLFIESMTRVISKSEKKIKVFIIGDGDQKHEIIDTLRSRNIGCSATDYDLSFDKSLRSANSRAGDSNNTSFTFTSWIRSIDYAYAGLDIVALTSMNEGTPVSLIEAQASGTAIVSTDVGGVSEVMDDQKSGLLCESNPKAISDAILTLINDPDLRESMGIYGAHKAHSEYTYIRLVKEMNSLYCNLLNQV
ncbi:MAG: hypothetical protein COB85_09750 [Bacteroidetes bacterium]|nr:MAG: hypothetical protein COB85_09750 [Bacteroidota bacterium]